MTVESIEVDDRELRIMRMTAMRTAAAILGSGSDEVAVAELADKLVNYYFTGVLK